MSVAGHRALQTSLQRRDVGRLQTLRALLRFEAHLLIFSERLEAVAADFGEVREQVVAALVRVPPQPNSPPGSFSRLDSRRRGEEV
jgi:hypothetical protein